jgi:uncharacterized protein YdeI (YjbR/CyaY-like superfamily)
MARGEVERHAADGWEILPFASGEAFAAWLDAHHAERPGVWVKFAKKGRGIASVTFEEALEVATCYGWVDSKMHAYDDDHYILRYQPRRPRSAWSARNRALAERLVAEGRMRPAGMARIAAAKADGRWGAP